MTELRNPYTGKPYATEAQCPPPGTEVPSRLRTPMESLEVRKTLQHTAMQFDNTARRQQRQQQQPSSPPPPTGVDKNDGFIGNDGNKVGLAVADNYTGTGTNNDNNSTSNIDYSSSNSRKSHTSGTTVPPNSSQKLERDEVHHHLVNWDGPMVSMSDNKTLILKASKAIFDRM